MVRALVGDSTMTRASPARGAGPALVRALALAGAADLARLALAGAAGLGARPCAPTAGFDLGTAGRAPTAADLARLAGLALPSVCPSVRLSVFFAMTSI